MQAILRGLSGAASPTYYRTWIRQQDEMEDAPTKRDQAVEVSEVVFLREILARVRRILQYADIACTMTWVIDWRVQSAS